MKEVVLVPLHVLPTLLQHHSHGMTPQQTTEHPNTQKKRKAEWSRIQSSDLYTGFYTFGLQLFLLQLLVFLSMFKKKKKRKNLSIFAHNFECVGKTIQSHPRTRMLVSKTDTTISLSSRTSDRTLLTAASNSAVLFKSWEKQNIQRQASIWKAFILTAKTVANDWKIYLEVSKSFFNDINIYLSILNNLKPPVIYP